VDTAAAKSVSVKAPVLQELNTIFEAHQSLPKPEKAGGGVGGPR
jgi:hypothetical protein